MTEKKAVRELRLFTDKEFKLVQDLCAAPSPVGFEAAMIEKVVIPELESFMPSHWKIHRFVGNPGLVLDTAPDAQDVLKVMIIGHADKIRLQVRSIDKDGKIWVNTDSFLPAAIIGHRFDLVIEDKDCKGGYTIMSDLTAQAFGAIHFASEEVRSGKKGVTDKEIYLETGLFGDKRKERLEELGVRPGQAAIFSRSVTRAPAAGTFYGAYLDNALGCFAVIETARRLATLEPTPRRGKYSLPGVRMLLTIASHEEIGLMGSRIAAGEFKPDVVIATDVTHDYEAAPGIADRRYQPIGLGKGAVVTNGTIHSYPLVSMALRIAKEKNIAVQRNFAGRMEGNDSMAAVNASIDAASFSVSFPIRNMHTSSELAHDGDVLAAVDMLTELSLRLSSDRWTRERFKQSHVVLDRGHMAPVLPPPPAEPK